MIAAWMTFVLIIGAFVTIAAITLHSLQRSAHRPVRWVWASAMALLIGLALVAPMRSPPPVILSVAMVDRADITPAPTAEHSLTARASAALQALRHVVATPIVTATERAAHLPPLAQRALLGLWLSSSMLLLLFMRRVFARLHAQRQQWPTQSLHGTRVRVSSSAGPAVMGIAPPEIVVPAWILERSVDEQRLVLAHELQHVRARDPLLLVLAWLGVAIMPWHPAMWYLWSRLRLAIELDCDRRVLRAGAAPRQYGQLLIDLTGRRTALSVGIPAFSYSASYLERRLLAMTARPSRFLTLRRASGALIASLAILAACESKLPTSAEVSSMDVASATKRAATFGLDTTLTTYLVNGTRTNAAEALKIASESIATINVSRGGVSKGLVVGIRTKQGDKVLMVPTAAVGANEKKAFTGLLVVDGVITDAARMNAINPTSIETVDVIKGPAATSLYTDPRAANGVIVIKLKKTS